MLQNCGIDAQSLLYRLSTRLSTCYNATQSLLCRRVLSDLMLLLRGLAPFGQWTFAALDNRGRQLASNDCVQEMYSFNVTQRFVDRRVQILPVLMITHKWLHAVYACSGRKRQLSLNYMYMQIGQSVPKNTSKCRMCGMRFWGTSCIFNIYVMTSCDAQYCRSKNLPSYYYKLISMLIWCILDVLSSFILVFMLYLLNIVKNVL